MRAGDIAHWFLTGELTRSAPVPTDPPDADGPDPITRAIQRAVEDRIAAFTFADALALPAVSRAVDLLASQAAALSVAAYLDGLRLDRKSVV